MPRARVLVVDDDEDIQLIVQTLLAAAGYEVRTAATGREAVRLAVAERPDLILLDVMMPQMSGWEVCATLRSLPETARVPIVMLTVKSEIKDLVQGLQVGADDYLTKPFTKRRLLEAVERLLEEGGGDDTARQLFPADTTTLQAKNLLFDAVTGLPTIPVIVDALRDRLLAGGELGVLFVDIERYSHIEDFYGWEVFDDVLREASRALRRLLGTLFSTGDLLAINRPSGSEFYVFLALEDGGAEGVAQDLARRARQLEENLRQQLSERFQGRIHRKIGLYVGHARIRPNPQVRLERLVYRSLREAVAITSSKEGERAARLREEFKDILTGERIATVYQPIVDLQTGRIFAHEALSRGPAESAFENPEVLFDYAVRHEAVWDLERLCVAFSAKRFRPHGQGALFVNLEAQLIHEMKTRGHEILAPLVDLPGGVVLEITERAAIHDYDLFRDALGRLREQGFRIAIDDAGSGYASLQAIAELKPSYLKIAQTLVAGLHRETIKRDVVEMLVKLAARIGAKTVAEGIETDDELADVRRLGVSYGQGFLLGRPRAIEEIVAAEA